MTRTLLTSTLAIFAAVAFSGCATFFSSKNSLTRVDELLGQIEKVHVETELSQEAVTAAATALQALVAADFSGDPVTAYNVFLNAIESSEQQANRLRTSAADMKDLAEDVFYRWAKELSSFTSAEMRQRSQLRLERTRDRYKEILAAVEPAQWSYDSFNRTLRDHALFLSHDFNTTSVGEIGDGVVVITGQSEELERRFDACLSAARNYVDATALPGHAEPPRP